MVGLTVIIQKEAEHQLPWGITEVNPQVIQLIPGEMRQNHMVPTAAHR